MVKAARIAGILAREASKIGKQGSKVPGGISTFKSKPVKGEVITRAVVVVKMRDGGDEFIFYGTNHGEAYTLAEDKFGTSREHNPFSAGFALFETSAGRIVNRVEAGRIADKEGQLDTAADPSAEGALAEDIRGIHQKEDELLGGGGDTDLKGEALVLGEEEEPNIIAPGLPDRKPKPPILVKEGVTLETLNPEILSAIDIATPLFTELGVDLVVTSATEGKHKKGSRHFSGNAIDLRTRQLAPANQKKIVKELKKLLGPNFDVVLEKDHIHVEFDPKP